MEAKSTKRLGAELGSDGGVSFWLWAPRRSRVEVIIGNSDNESNQKTLVTDLKQEKGTWMK